jgi:hypothetical protein
MTRACDTECSLSLCGAGTLAREMPAAERSLGGSRLVGAEVGAEDGSFAPTDSRGRLSPQARID